MSQNSVVVSISANDVLYFGTGRPFNQQDEGLAEQASVFPPSPKTLAGALTACMARKLGWNEGKKGDWENNFRFEPKEYSFLGPFFRRGNGSSDVFFPIPSFVCWADESEETVTLLSPMINGQPKLQSDLGSLTRVSSVDGKPHPKAIHGVVNQASMASFVEGNTISKHNVYLFSSIGAMEKTVGIARNHKTHTAKEGQLYASEQFRMKESSDGEWSILCDIQSGKGIPNMNLNGMPLGGEARFASVRQLETNSIRKVLNDTTKAGEDEVCRTKKFILVFVTPVKLNLNDKLASFGGLPGKFVSIVCGKPKIEGGRRSSGNVAVYPAGTSIFFEELEKDGWGKLSELSVSGLGDDTKLGFGAFVIMPWPNQSSTDGDKNSVGK